MEEKIHKWLFDIKLAIDEIDSYFERYPKTYLEYSENPLLKRAIERNLEIIGEAINRILKEAPETKIKDAKRIIGLRNQIIHSYDNISDDIIWAIVIKHLPILRQDINNLIS